MNNTLTAIILIDYYGYNDTKECIDSLLKMNNHNYRVIIVNNTSKKNDQLLEDNFIVDNADIIESGDNRGFSGGNNIGIEYAAEKYKPEFYLLLNNDTIVDKHLLDELINGYRSDVGIGIVTGKITRYPNQKLIWYGGGDYFENICTTKMRGYGKPDDGSYNSPGYVGFAPGCLLFFHKSLIDKIGYMNEKYFLYCEDTDFGFNTMNSGLKILYWPKAIIAHKESISTGKGSPTHQYYYTRNKLYIIKKFGKNKIVKAHAYIRLSYIIWKDVFRGRRDFEHTSRAYMDFFRGKMGKNTLYSKG